MFTGFDGQGKACHAHMKGIYSYGESFRLNVEGSDPAYGFGFCGKGTRLYVFEATIDLLSFLTLYPLSWQEQSYICLDGLSEHAMLKMLQTHSVINEVVLCLDHDPAGIEGCYRLKEILERKRYDKVTRLTSRNKDWNEDLKERNGIQPIPAREHPGLISFRNMCIWLKGLTEIEDTEKIALQKVEDTGHHLKLLLRRQEMYHESISVAYEKIKQYHRCLDNKNLDGKEYGKTVRYRDYDEAMVRRLIEKIEVKSKEKYSIILKSGQMMEVSIEEDT